MNDIIKDYAEGRRDFRFTVIGGEYFCGTDYKGANLAGADLSGANFAGVNLSGADLRGANLAGVNLSGATLTEANLSGANLAGACITIARLNEANLSGANLAGADLRGSLLTGTNLAKANLTSARIAFVEGGGAGAFVKNAPDEDCFITYTAETLAIGSEQHSHQSWWEFTDEEISRLDYISLYWWDERKDWLYVYVQNNPAQPTTTHN